MTHPHHKQVGQHSDAHGLLTAVCVPADLVLAQPQARFQLPVYQLDRPTFLGDAHDLARCQLGQIGHQEFRVVGADVTPFFTQYQGDIPDMTQTQARVIRPKGSAAFPPMLSGNPGALVILVRHMGHEIFERFLLHRFPGTGYGKDKAPAAGRVGRVTVLDHAHICLGALGGIAAHDHHLCPGWGHKRAHPLAKQGVCAAIRGVVFGQDEPKAHRHTLPVPRGHQQHKAQAKKPGMMLADAPFLRHGIFGAAFVSVTAITKEIQHAIGGWRQGGQEILRQPAHEEMHVNWLQVLPIGLTYCNV